MKDLLPLEKETELLHGTPLSMSYDGKEDFFVWQDRAKGKLHELLGLDKFKKCDSAFRIEYSKKHKNFTEIRFVFQSEENYFVPCILSVPVNAEKPPVMLCLQGHCTGMHITLGRMKYKADLKRRLKGNGDRDFALQCIERGVCALAIEQRCIGEKGGTPMPDCHSSTMTALLTGRTVIGARVWDIMNAVDVLKKEFSDICDCENIGCMGLSGGGTAAIYAGAFEPEIKAVMPACAFCTFEDSIGSKRHCECNYIPNIRNYFDMAEIAALSAPKPMIIVSGAEDGIFPAEPAKKEFERLKAYYKAAGAEDKCAHVIGNGGHRFYADEAWKKYDEVTENV